MIVKVWRSRGLWIRVPYNVVIQEKGVSKEKVQSAMMGIPSSLTGAYKSISPELIVV
jgi:hypothetical protein